MKEIEKLARLLQESKDTMVLTGAGISTESGIPDFRSPDTGIWAKMDPMEVFSRRVLEYTPEIFWHRGTPIFRDLASAKPNAAHFALAQLEEMGIIQTPVTQNIDDLHQRAGSNTVMEVQGHLRTATCPWCQDSQDLMAVLNRVQGGENPPTCGCGGLLRPDIVLFGDALPGVFAQAWEKAATCELLLVIGSSLEVAPVCWLVPRASQVAIINLAPTSCDDLAEVIIREKAGTALTALVEMLTREVKSRK